MLNRGGIVAHQPMIKLAVNFTDVQTRKQGDIPGVIAVCAFIDTPYIQQLHALALSHGGTDEGAPGLRPHYGEGFYSAYVRDPDGNKLAFVYYTA